MTLISALRFCLEEGERFGNCVCELREGRDGGVGWLGTGLSVNHAPVFIVRQRHAQVRQCI